MKSQRLKALQREAQRNANAWPPELVEIPREAWPVRRPELTEYPSRIWRSRHFLVMQYAEPVFLGREVLRLSVNRTTLAGNGRWDGNISWDDLQRCKREAGYGDWYAVEIYPRDRDLVDVANMRHLWLVAVPLRIGWFAPGAIEPDAASGNVALAAALGQGGRT